MEGTEANTGIVGGSGFIQAKSRKPWRKKVLIVLIALVLLVGAYALFLFFKPLYVIGDVSISRKDVAEYVRGLDEYKKQQPQVDFGDDHKRVATDDLVLNAAFKLEVKTSGEKGLEKILASLNKTERTGSAQSKRMQKVRAENSTYQRYLESKILATKDLVTVSIPFDAPLYDGKSPEQVKALRQQSLDILNKKFMPLVGGKSAKERIAAEADVNVLDNDTTDDTNHRLYYDGLVTVVDQQIGEVQGAIEYNDIDQEEYYGVKVDNLRDTAGEIAKLTKVGQHTGVFASRTGSYMVVRLEKIYGGKYVNWEDFLKQHKQKYARSKLLAYDLTPSRALNYVGNQAVLMMTTPGLQTAWAATCSNSHNVLFGIVSFDDTANAQIPNGTTIKQSRSAHDCGSQFAGDRLSSDFLADNCMGPQPTWSVVSFADSSKYTFTRLTTSDKTGTYDGWPKWVASRINGAKTILITFRYVQKPPDNTARRASNLEVATCDSIGGWIFDSAVAGGVGNAVDVHVYFDGPVAPGKAGYNSGPANLIRTDVEAAYPGVGNNHGFGFDPTTAPLPINIRDGRSHTAYFYAGNAGSYEFARATIPACGPREPQPPTVTVDDDCDYFNFIARDTENQTSTFTYDVQISNGGPSPKVFSFTNVTGWQGITPWAPSGVSLTDANGVHWRVTATEVGGGGKTNVATGVLPRCPFNEARVTIAESAPKLLPDAEEPTSVEFSARFDPSQPIRTVDTECTYFIRPTVGPERPLGGGEVKTHYLDAPYTCAATLNLPPPRLTAGDEVCAYYKASPGKARTNLTNDSVIKVIEASAETVPTPTCTKVVNRPYVAFYGNDVFAGGGYGNDCAKESQIKTFTRAGSAGSGVQFAASAMDTIIDFNSARLRSGTVAPLPPSGLTFANLGGASGDIGVGQHCLYDYYGDKDNDKLPQTFAGATGTIAEGKWQHAGDLTLGGAGALEVAAGTAVALYVDGNVTIKNNITYASDSWGGVDQVPSFYLIVKGNVFIDPGVTQLDGMYIMQPNDSPPPAISGTMYTCYNSALSTNQFAATARFNTCDKQLTINGGLQAVRVYFDRVTPYSLRDADASENKASTSKAAEVVNFSPEMYLATPQIPRKSESGGSGNENLQVLPPLL